MAGCCGPRSGLCGERWKRCGRRDRRSVGRSCLDAASAYVYAARDSLGAYRPTVFPARGIGRDFGDAVVCSTHQPVGQERVGTLCFALLRRSDDRRGDAEPHLVGEAATRGASLARRHGLRCRRLGGPVVATRRMGRHGSGARWPGRNPATRWRNAGEAGCVGGTRMRGPAIGCRKPLELDATGRSAVGGQWGDRGCCRRWAR